MGNKTTDQMKQAIRDADPTETNASIAKRIGLSQDLVSYHRRRLEKEAKSAKTKKSTSLARSGKQGWEPVPETELPLVHAVTINLSEKTLNTWWVSQPLSRKAAIFGTFFELRVEGSVR